MHPVTRQYVTEMGMGSMLWSGQWVGSMLWSGQWVGVECQEMQQALLVIRHQRLSWRSLQLLKFQQSKAKICCSCYCYLT